ncbi:hypothetical protein GPECTOR_941g199 [Gonium pectorale]|uniref:HYR domain-containing protein n=1 Tax=Gonium pectorale TaxID=33097 RepID=A0A150FTT7_GONPE|nr:hypothetical protein GPECTOR_941g199 [Gonium pectorale]|eukprot:KXZ41033.1 hypothetical protein GPECTOR_941g199 [Gonium pectorale]
MLLGYSRSVCNSRGANPCVAANSICNALSPTSYNCTCDSSFLYDKFTKTCYSDPCFDPSVCGGPTKAVTCNTFNATAYTCTCKAGFYFDSAAKTCKADTVPPVLNVPTGIVVEATASTGADVFYTATAYDLVSGEVATECDPPPGSRFGLTGTGAGTMVICKATDGAGNAVTRSFRVRVGELHGLPTK